MTPITSGTSTERVVRSLLLSLLVDFFAVYFLYDGYIGYPQKNAAELAKLLGLPASQTPPVNAELTGEQGRRLESSIDTIVTSLGPPAVRQTDAGYYLGPGGWLKVELQGDRVRSAKWYDGPHSESDQSIQKFIGWLLVIIGFAATINLGRVIATRAQLSDHGLQVTGRPLIPFESMTGLRSSTSFRTSELQYTLNGKAGTIRLDPYLYKNAAAISRTIAERKNFAPVSNA